MWHERKRSQLVSTVSRKIMKYEELMHGFCEAQGDFAFGLLLPT